MALDGKTLRGAHNKAQGQESIEIISARAASQRRLVLNLLRRDQTKKGGTRIKRLKAALHEDYLRRILNSQCACPALVSIKVSNAP